MTPQKLKFINSLLKLMKIDDDVFVIEAIDKMTSHITENQYAEFISKIAEGKEYARPLEIIKSVSDKYMGEIKSELFKDVEAEAKELEKKLERYFVQIEENFRTSSETYNPGYAKQYESPSGLIKNITISKNWYWNDKDVHLIKKIGFSTLYELYNDPYKQMWEAIAKETKNVLSKKYLMPSQKQVGVNSAIKQLANNKGMK